MNETQIRRRFAFLMIISENVYYYARCRVSYTYSLIKINVLLPTISILAFIDTNFPTIIIITIDSLIIFYNTHVTKFVQRFIFWKSICMFSGIFMGHDFNIFFILSVIEYKSIVRFSNFFYGIIPILFDYNYVYI